MSFIQEKEQQSQQQQDQFQGEIQQDDIINNFLVRGLDKDQEDLDDLDRQIDQEVIYFDEEKFQNELLFNVQGLGSIKKINNIDLYVKGKDCEDCLKDLIRACRKDDQDKLQARYELGKWNIVQSDLIWLLVTQPQDKKLSYYLLILLVLLTEYPPNTSPRKQFFINMLQSYKLSFLTKDVIKTLMIHLADCIEEQQQTKAHAQMIELIIILIKNILQIPDLEQSSSSADELKRKLQYFTIVNLAKENAFDALIYMCQDFSTPLMDKLSLTFLEIFYHIYSCFDVHWIVWTGASSNEPSEMQKLIEKDRQEKSKRLLQLSTRHSKFQTNYQLQRLIDKSSKLITNPYSDKQKDINSNVYQRKQPLHRKVIQKYQSIYRPFIYDDTIIQLENGEKPFNKIIDYYANDFITNAFSPLIEKVFNEFEKKSTRLEENDKMYYYVIQTFGIQYIREKYALQKKFNQENAELNLSDIAAAIQNTQIELTYKGMLDEVSRVQKTKFNYKNYYAVLRCFLELLYLVRDIDIVKILRIGFEYCIPGAIQDELLITLGLTQGIFFDLLESYSKGKVLTIQTEQMLRKKLKKKKKKNEDIDDFIEKDHQYDNEDESFQIEKEQDNNNNNVVEEENKVTQNENQEKEIIESEDEDDDDDDNNPQYKERKFNLMSEFAYLAEYQVITKLIYLIEDNKLLNNTSELNQAIYRYMKRIVDLLKAEWIFFQADYFIKFYNIINHPEIKVRLDLRNIVEIINKIIKSFLNYLQKNELLIVEILFRFTDRGLKDQILNNYENIMDEEINQFNNNNSNEIGEFQENENIEIQSNIRWSKSEDRVLIDYYERFKDQENIENNLMLVLNNLGFTSKSPQEIKQRIKILKLRKGRDRAEQIFSEFYSSDKMTIEESIQSILSNNDDTLKKEDLLIFIETQLFNYKEYYQQYQNESKINECFSQLQDFCIIPLAIKEFDFLENQLVQNLLLSMNFNPPSQGQCFWRIPGQFKLDDCQRLIDKLKYQFTKQQQKSEKQKQEIINNKDDIDLEIEQQLKLKKEIDKKNKIAYENLINNIVVEDQDYKIKHVQDNENENIENDKQQEDESNNEQLKQYKHLKKKSKTKSINNNQIDEEELNAIFDE